MSVAVYIYYPRMCRTCISTCTDHIAMSIIIQITLIYFIICESLNLHMCSIILGEAA